MSDGKSPETLVDADLDEIQGAGTAVGNPGEATKRQVTSVANAIKPDNRKVLGSRVDGSI